MLDSNERLNIIDNVRVLSNVIKKTNKHLFDA